MLATGSAPRTLPGLTMDGEHILTSEHAWRLDRLPGSAIVLGGGVIGCEFASAWRSFGVEVTIVEALPRLLSGRGAGGLRRPGTRLPQARPHRDHRGADGVRDRGVRRRPVDHGRRPALTAELLLVAVGRGPFSDGLGYAEAGVGLDRGFVIGGRAAADVRPRGVRGRRPGAGLQLAHRGFAHGIFVAEDVALGWAGRNPTGPGDDRDIPRVTYCDPEVASVGLTEEAATARSGRPRPSPMTWPATASRRSSRPRGS